MLTFVAAFLLALVVATVLTPIVTALAHRFQLFDLPDHGRKVHVNAIPRLGGIAVVLAMLTPIAGLSLHDNAVARALFADVTLVWAFALGALGIVGLGIYDDLRGAGAKTKFSVQIVVATAMWAAGFRIDAVGGSFGLAVDLGMLSLPLTVLWIVGVVNAVNLIDGLDGLAAGIALIAATALFGVALMNGQVLLALCMAALAGSLVGFLFFNANPALIFLGDSGSLFLGFVLAVVSLWTHHKAATAVTVITALPLCVVAVPILDTTLCIIRRTSRGQSPFSPDREHLHHRLMALGLSHRAAVLTLHGVAALFALAGVALVDGNAVRITLAVVLALVAGIALVLRVGLFGDAPADAIGLVRSARDVARQVRDAPTLESAWRQVEHTLPALGCEEASLVVHTLHEGATAPTVLVWHRAEASEPRSAEHQALVLRGPRRGGRVGALTARWPSRQDPPLRAAQRKALQSLHRALRDVSVRSSASALAPIVADLGEADRLNAAE
jgi:UDP-GlcNAc:undecaprenyl-phosphate GlcNAc-1-phosphate transferase